VVDTDGQTVLGAAAYSNGLTVNGTYVRNCSELNYLGSDFVIEVTMGNVKDYFRPIAGVNSACGKMNMGLVNLTLFAMLTHYLCFYLLLICHCVEMLTSYVKHEYSPTPDGPWVVPGYFNASVANLGGSLEYFPLNNVTGDSRFSLSVWGCNGCITNASGGCCASNINNNSITWKQPFVMRIAHTTESCSFNVVTGIGVG